MFKIPGAIVLILTAIKSRFKEWAYVGFGINLFALPFRIL